MSGADLDSFIPCSLDTLKDAMKDAGLQPGWWDSRRKNKLRSYCPHNSDRPHSEGNAKFKLKVWLDGDEVIAHCDDCGRLDPSLIGLKDVRTPTAVYEPAATTSSECPTSHQIGDSIHVLSVGDDSPIPEVEAPNPANIEPPQREWIEPELPHGREPGSDDEPTDSPAKPTTPRFNLPAFSGCTEDELNNAKLHPKCFVENLYYADVGTLFAPGGVGKTTVKIYESICLALGRDLWGYPVINPGKTIIMTAEDSRDLILARMREIMNAMNLTPNERNFVRSQIMVIDVSGDIQRLAESDAANNLVITSLADSIVEQYQNNHIAQFIFDPAIRFGPGERFINDGEDMIIIACRRIVRGLNCLVQIIHHTGKANARNGTLDQYSGRGGSAFSDGCRMVTVLSNNGDMKNPPEGYELLPGDSGFVMARPKLSYCKPQPNIWIRRHGWEFEYFVEEVKSSDEILSRNMERIAKFLRDELHHGRKFTKKSLENTSLDALKMSRNELRSALSAMEVCGRMTERELPDDERQGGRKGYLVILTAPK